MNQKIFGYGQPYRGRLFWWGRSKPTMRQCPVNQVTNCNVLGTNQRCSDFYEVSYEGTPYSCRPDRRRRRQCRAKDREACMTSSACTWNTGTDPPHCALSLPPCTRGGRSECHRGPLPVVRAGPWYLPPWYAVPAGPGCCDPQRRPSERFTPYAECGAAQWIGANAAGPFYVRSGSSPYATCQTISDKLARGVPLTRLEQMIVAGADRLP